MTETHFKGFPSRSEVTPLPNIFFSDLLPRMSNASEIKVVLHIFFLLSRRKGYPRFVSFRELLNDPVILKSLSNQAEKIEDILRGSLQEAVKTGIIIHIPVEKDGISDDIYLLNNESERDIITRIISGELKLPSMMVRTQEELPAEQIPDIYSLYEKNIGMLTPILAEELQEAEHKYPADWIQEAFRIALRSNVRNWKYVHGILKRWEREGKKSGEPVRYFKKERDPNAYIKGKYGHLVQR
jgi:DnaD/phage-associated family protein